MRFKTGSKVEVLCKEVPSVSWLSAGIISGNGHYYNVRYDCPAGAASEAIVERVSRKVIRPCPPVVCVKSWVSGDVVEVFNDVSWRTVVVSKVLRRDIYLVRLLGSSREFEVHKFNIRVRQLWQDDKWIVIEKGSRTCEDVKFERLSTSKCYQKSSQGIPANVKRKFHAEDVHLAVQSKIGLQESHIVSSRTLKRASPYCSSHVDTCTGNVEKMRAVEKEGRRQRFAQSPLLRKVDAVAYPQDNLGEKYMHASFNIRTTEYHERERGKMNGLIKCCLAGSSEPNDFDSDVCSVGSCSVISDKINELPSRMLPGHSHDINTSDSDAESFCDWRDEKEECPLPPKEELAARIHRLELHAYRSTLEAFYASGPLSWKLEALLTDLRILLHISNDEHLIELKTLVSSGTSLLIS